MAGWIGLLEGKDVYSEMLNAACRWRWEIRYRSGLDFERMRVIEGCPDFGPLSSLDPSVEDQVIGCEVMRLLERKLSPKALLLLEQMILNGNTKVSSEDAKRLGLSIIGNTPRKKKIRKLVIEALGGGKWEK